MDGGAQAPGAVVAQHGAVYQYFLAPAHEVSDEGAESGVGEKVAVGGRCVGFVEQFEGLLLWYTAYTLVREGVVGGVEDAVAGGCGWEEYPC